MSTLYLLILVLYSISVLGYFIDFMQNNQKVNRWAFWLLSIVWGLQLALFVWRYVAMERLPIMTAFEGMYVYAWILVSVSLFLNHRLKMNAFILLVNAIGFIMLAVSLSAPGDNVSSELASVLITEFLIVHVGLLMLSYGAFTVSFAFSVIYVIQHKLLKKKRWGSWMAKLGNLSTLERNSYYAALVGLPLLFTGLVLGVVWASVAVGSIPWLDVKVLGSIVVLLVYGAFLVQYRVAGMRGYNLALLNTAAFLLLLINYFLSGTFSEFHLW